jgi:glycosyltransferase involved in cell wall biosynthesis
MDKIAGHVTNYHNLRGVATLDPELEAIWHEIHYYKPGGAIEKIRERVLPVLPTYATGIMRGAWEAHKALRRGSYDALFSNASVGVFFSRTFRRIPTMIDFDSTPLQIDQMGAYNSSADPKPVAAFKWRLTRDMMHAATLLQAWSRWAKQSAIDDYGIPADKIVVNPPGVNLSFWRPNPALREASPQPLKVLFVGGDFRRKGGDLLLEWYKLQDPNTVELHIVTREPVDSGLGVYVYHNVQPNSAQLISLYQSSDLFVLPSLGECFGIATVEAMAAGLPVIASHVGGTADIIEVGRNGFIVPGNDVAALRNAISTILEDTTRRKYMGAQSRLLAEERFDLRKNAQRTFNYLKQIAAAPVSHPISIEIERSPENYAEPSKTVSVKRYQ